MLYMDCLDLLLSSASHLAFVSHWMDDGCEVVLSPSLA